MLDHESRELRRHGFADAAKRAAAIADYFDGVMLHGVTVRPASGIRTSDIADVIRRIIA